MDYDHMEFVEAIEALAQMLGIDVPYEQGGAPPRKAEGLDAMFAAMEQCSQYYQQQLKQSATAIEYLK